MAHPAAGLITALPSPQSKVRVAAGAAGLRSVKLKGHDADGSQILNVVRPLNVLISSGPVELICAFGVTFTVTATTSVVVHPLASVTVRVRFTTWVLFTGTG